MSPVNPGERHPEPTKTQQVAARTAAIVRDNKTLVAYILGQSIAVIIFIALRGFGSC